MTAKARTRLGLLGCLALVAALTQASGSDRAPAVTAPMLAPVAAPAPLQAPTATPPPLQAPTATPPASTPSGAPVSGAPVSAPPTSDVPAVPGPEPREEYVKYYPVVASDQGAPESLAGIAGRLLGAPGRAEEIYRLNAGRRQPDGQALTDSRQLRAGWYLVLPWDAVGAGVQQGRLPTEAPPPEPGMPQSATAPQSGTPQSATAPQSARQSAPPGSATVSPGPAHGGVPGQSRGAPRRTENPPPATAPAGPGAPVGPSAPVGPGAPVAPTAPVSPRRPGLCAVSVPSRPGSAWAHERMAAEQAWGRTRGEGVLVAVVDSGVDASVPELSGRVALGADTPSGSGRGDTDCLGSGTAMASIIAARSATPDAPSGGAVVGMAPDATILPLRVVHDTPRSEPADAATAIEVAVSAGARVVALGAFVDLSDAAVQGAIRSALDHDVVVVAPAPPASTGTPPPAPEGLLRVGGVGPEGQPAARYQPAGVDVVAPGIDVASLGAAGAGVRASSGSQYAVAFVAGTVTLVRSAFPNLDAAAVVHRIEATADHAGRDEPDPVTGWGMVNPNAAVTMVLVQESQPGGDDGDDGRAPLPVLAVALLVVIGLAAVTVLARRTPARLARAEAGTAGPSTGPAGTGDPVVDPGAAEGPGEPADRTVRS